MKTKLNDYIQKRNFDTTSEPKGKIEESKNRLRFVVQHHLASADHYDFRLEWEGVLLSWAVPKGPSFDPQDKRLAIKVEDHPLDYRHFEGTIPKGEYGGGTVMLWDEGFWDPLTDVEEGLKKGELKFSLNGRRLKGNWALIKWKSISDKKKSQWLLIKERDEYIKDKDGISGFDTSIKTGRTLLEIKNGIAKKSLENPFRKANSQLAKLVDKMPEDRGWIYEVKYDGYRIMAFVENNSIRLMTRNNNDYLKRFSPIGRVITEFAADRSMVLDGEIVVVDEIGKADFQELQNYLNSSSKKNLTYIVFDILALDGEDLRNHSLIERKTILKNLMENAPDELHYSNYIEGDEAIFEAACEADLEGVVGKKRDSSYNGNRDGSWIKIKCDKCQEFVIGGYVVTDKRESGVSSLLLGVYEDKELIYVGRAGTGISETDIKILVKEFANLQRDKPYFMDAPKKRVNEEITWLKPDLVAEIKFANWTKNNLLRHASFIGLRTDKDPLNIIKDMPDNPKQEDIDKDNQSIRKDSTINNIKITHPDKIVFDSDKITKIEVVEYYEKVGKRMLPHISDRILSVVRCPKGISESCFFLKHPVGDSEYITTIQINESSGKKDDYFYINDVSGIINEIQLGTIEFHTWGSDIKRLEKPSVMVFDLDPDVGMDISKVRQGVWDLKSILDELSLISFIKTSGGKGYHVVVPIKASVSWDVFHEFARNIAEVMVKKWPNRYTENVRKEKRKNKIFIDWLRNGRGATSVAPYSIRARQGAKVSMPIKWDEVDLISPDDIDMEQAVLRLEEEDPWKGFFETQQMLK